MGFKLIEENINSLRLGDGAFVYDYGQYHALVDAAAAVRGEMVFADIEWPQYSSVRLFGYQKTAVTTMLKVFEGRGIFGDQVGLGKTLMALATAHIMYLKQEIKNCLIVCPPALIEQWKDEIRNKFRDLKGECVFDIVNQDLDPNNVATFKQLFEERREKSSGKCPVFLLSTDSLMASRNLENERTAATKVLQIKQKLQSDMDKLKKLQIERGKRLEMLKNAPTPRQSAEIYYRRLQGRKDGEIDEKVFEKIDGELASLSEEIDNLRQTIDSLTNALNVAESSSLWNNNIDLFIMDEADVHVSGAVEKIKSKNEGRAAEGKRQLSAIESIPKKYCILISATPIRKDLDDVYHLIKIVDPNRFSDVDSFHRYVEASTLSDLVSEPAKIRRFNGLVNSIFTRARICDCDVAETSQPLKEWETMVHCLLKEDMECAKHIFKERDVAKCGERIEKIRACIERELQGAVKGSQQACYTVDDVLKKAIGMAEMGDFFKGLVMRGLKAYYIESGDVTVHAYIDWRRPEKEGSCYWAKGETQEERDKSQNDRIIKMLSESSIPEKVVIYEAFIDERKALYQALRQNFPQRKIFADLDDKDFWKECDENFEGGYQEFKANNAREFNKLDLEYYDAIYLTDVTRTEGANLNCASRLIVCQLRSPTRGLLDPLRFEQLIGRINRVGQMQVMRIDVIVDTPEENALYELYADKDGLDMVGKGRAEVSFVIPIVTESCRVQHKMHKADFIDIFEKCFESNELKWLHKQIKDCCNALSTNRQVGGAD